MKRLTLPVVFADYKVTLRTRHPEVDGEKVQGFCYFAKSEIVVFDGPNKELTRATMWHESVHAILRELGRSELMNDEALVDGLANAIMRIRLKEPWI